MYLPVTPHFITKHTQITINLITFCLSHKSNRLKTYTIYFSYACILLPVSVKGKGNIFVYTGKPNPLYSSECRMVTLHTLHELSVYGHSSAHEPLYIKVSWLNQHESNKPNGKVSCNYDLVYIQYAWNNTYTFLSSTELEFATR